MEESERLIRERFPQMSWALAHPELGPLLRRAVGEGWDAPRLQGELLNTSWFRTTKESEREWDRRAAEDPAEALAAFYGGVYKVSHLAEQLGVTLTQAQYAQLGNQAGRSAWDDQHIIDVILDQAAYQPSGELKGQMNATVDRIRQQATDYYTPITDEAAWGMARNMLKGNMDAASLQAYFKDQAVNRFGSNKSMVDMLNRGMTATQIFAPYVQQTAQLLERSPSEINLMDQKFNRIIDHADEQGNLRPMTLSEAGKMVRGMDEYKGTQGAMSQAAEFAEFIAQKMGRVA